VRLRHIERLIRFVDVVRKFKLKCETISLGRIVFTYSEDPLLKANIGLGGDAGMTMSLEKNNPHLLIQDFLIRHLNAENGLEHVTLLLGLTLPLVRTLDEIVKRPRKGEALVLPRAVDWFHLRFCNPDCTFDIRLRQRRDEFKWFLRDGTDQHHIKERKEDFASALKELFLESGEDWLGLRTGVAAGVNGVGDILLKIDECVRKFESAGEAQTAGAGQGKDTERQDIVVLD